MSAPVIKSQGKAKIAHREILKIKEGIEMRLPAGMTKVKAWFSQGLVTQHPVKLLGGLALGALLVTAIGLPLGLTSQGRD